MQIGKTGVNIEFMGHSGFLIECKGGVRIAIDPYNISDSAAGKGKVDIILITHSHYDHCSVKDIEKLVDKNKGCVVVCTADSQSKIVKVEGAKIEVIEAGDKMELSGGGVKIEAIVAYNKYREYHPKSEGWVGYLLKIGSVILYHAGDTDFIPEMKKLSGYGKHGNEFVALLPVSGKFVMNAEQAADAASVISPDFAVPMHYGAGVAGTLEDAQKFSEICKEMNIRTEILEKI